MPTLYSLGNAKIVGTAPASGVAGVKRSRSAENTSAVTDELALHALQVYLQFYLFSGPRQGVPLLLSLPP